MMNQKATTLLVVLFWVFNEFLFKHGYDCMSLISDFDNQTLNYSIFNQINDYNSTFSIEYFNYSDSSTNIIQSINLTTPAINLNDFNNTTTNNTTTNNPTTNNPTTTIITSSITSTLENKNSSNTTDFDYELKSNQTISTTPIVNNFAEVIYNTTEVINIFINDSFDDSIQNNKTGLIINLINNHKLYFSILSFIIIFLFGFTILMMGFNYKLSKRNKKFTNKFMRNRKNISFDIIDNGYRLNRNSAKIINRTDSVVSHIINDKFEININNHINNLNQTYERITNDSSENIYELPYIDSSILINDKSTYYKSANNEFKFQTFNAKKFENLKKKSDLIDTVNTQLNQLNEKKYEPQPVNEYLKSFNPTNENRKSGINNRFSLTNEFYTKSNNHNKNSTELISLNSNDSENESDYGENQNLSIDLNYRNITEENNNINTFHPTIISKCVETSFNPKSLTSTSRIQNFKEFQI